MFNTHSPRRLHPATPQHCHFYNCEQNVNTAHFCKEFLKIKKLKVSAFLLLKSTAGCHRRVEGAPAAAHNTNSGRRACPTRHGSVTSLLKVLLLAGELQQPVKWE